MIVPVINLLAGVALGGSAFLQYIGVLQGVDGESSYDNALKRWIGLATLLLGIIALIQRFGFITLIPSYLNVNLHYAQIITALLCGIILLEKYLRWIPGAQMFFDTIHPQKGWIGASAMLIAIIPIYVYCIPDCSFL